MVRLVTSIIFCLLLATMLSACQSNKTRSSVDNLNTTIKNYGLFIRWRSYDEAANHIRHRDGQAANKNTEALREIRVTKYQVLTVAIDEEKNEANVTAEITYYHERVNSVKTVTDHQLWWQDEETNKWHLEGVLPALAP